MFGSDKEDDDGLIVCVMLGSSLAGGHLVDFAWDCWWKRGEEIASGDTVGGLQHGWIQQKPQCSTIR